MDNHPDDPMRMLASLMSEFQKTVIQKTTPSEFRQKRRANPHFRAAMRARVNPTLCSLCRQFTGDILTKDVWLDRPPQWLRWNDICESSREGPRRRYFFAHRESGSFKQDTSLETCRLCRLMIHAFRQVQSRSLGVREGNRILIETPDFPSLNFRVVSSHGWMMGNFFGLLSDRNGFYDRWDDEWPLPWQNDEQEYQRYGDALAPLPSSDAPETYSWIARCLGLCMDHHTACKRSPSTLPTRVIDVGCSNGSQNSPRLFISNGLVAPYLALSYCWGKKTSMVLEKKTLCMFQEGIPDEALPATIRHAVEVTQKLGFRYLWVDALCIVQDDASDWETEASRMCDVYQDATLTIAGSESDDRYTGLFWHRSVKIAACGIGECFNIYVQRDESKAKDFENAILKTRGWTLQEEILSSAILHYRPSALFWECRTHLITEKGKTSMSHPILKNFMLRTGSADQLLGPRNTHWNVWYLIIEHYTSHRKLTRLSDALPALAGLAAKWEKEGWQTGRYLAGLWEGDLPQALLWKGAEVSSQQNKLVPSWTWASCCDDNFTELKLGTSEWPLPFERGESPLITNCDCKVENSNIWLSTNSKASGEIKGSIVLSGQLQIFTEKHLTLATRCLADDVPVTFAQINSISSAMDNVRYEWKFGDKEHTTDMDWSFCLDQEWKDRSKPLELMRVCSWPTGDNCCAQQTGMHKLGCGSTAYCYLPD
jgi:hypothetical protein